ncbi:MAG: hypothetical protein UX10_C0018G0014 [Candidatus Magasanikbacteria bacterium GW2011_GWA2_45_39]|uniref:SHOCT domain-containing protein n=1 Tax=Candidatus Magasanikbacteria bacterium GW2011_GWA2_45_39 TaxID=1619041 RepID=A0A0G1PNF3_9BACT|nr:MAG: hypothetical protein UX10_C0018G0014 [Candidatus Magasanikbacteria bacterium GW2011_GWA2_45_39]
MEIETKLDRLLDLQLDGSLSQTEYATKKHKLIKIAEKYHAEALCAEATSYDFTKSENWRRGRDSNSRTLAGQRFSRPPH